MTIQISFSNEKMRDFQSLVKQTSALSVQSGLVSTVLLLSLSSSCMNNKKEDVSVPQLEVEAPLETAANQCYQAIIGKDTITLTFMINSVNQFEGELDYSYYQKDKSFGTFLGNVKGDTIFADYTFQSQGKTSVRELTFLKNDPNTFVEGHGEVVEVNGKAVFKDKSKIKFDGNIIYNKIECQE